MGKKKHPQESDSLSSSSRVFVYNGEGLEEEDIPSRSFLEQLYYTVLGRFIRRFIRMKWFSQLCGIYYDSSISAQGIKPFVKRFNIDMSEALLDISSFRSFNDFFYRKLKPGSRQIDRNEKTLVSPCDARLLVIPSIEPTTIFQVKGRAYTLASFLESDVLAKQFQDSTLFLFRLAPPDYHRYHFPTQGVPSYPKKIHGVYESVNPLILEERVQPLIANERQITILNSSCFGAIAIISVGAMCVGRITQTYVPEKPVYKGDEMGYFSFGGSLVALLVSGKGLQVVDKFVDFSSQGIECKVKMGEVVAHI